MASYHSCQQAADQAVDDLRIIEVILFSVDPNSRAGLAAAQLHLILERIARGIPPGGASLENLVRLAISASEKDQLAEVPR
jgi:hypothetical protein